MIGCYCQFIRLSLSDETTFLNYSDFLNRLQRTNQITAALISLYITFASCWYFDRALDSNGSLKQSTRRKVTVEQYVEFVALLCRCKKPIFHYCRPQVIIYWVKLELAPNSLPGDLHRNTNFPERKIDFFFFVRIFCAGFGFVIGEKCHLRLGLLADRSRFGCWIWFTTICVVA